VLACMLCSHVMLQVSFVLDWIEQVFDGDDLNMDNCGVTTVNR
jgi:hypothetical protein